MSQGRNASDAERIFHSGEHTLRQAAGTGRVTSEPCPLKVGFFLDRKGLVSIGPFSRALVALIGDPDESVFMK